MRKLITIEPYIMDSKSVRITFNLFSFNIIIHILIFSSRNHQLMCYSFKDTGCYGQKDIANMWEDHYETLLSCVKPDECKGKIIDSLSSDSIKNVFIQPCQVKEALKCAKPCQ